MATDLGEQRGAVFAAGEMDRRHMVNDQRTNGIIGPRQGLDPHPHANCSVYGENEADSSAGYHDSLICSLRNFAKNYYRYCDRSPLVVRLPAHRKPRQVEKSTACTDAAQW
jgi:hypothetical protein